MKKVPFYVQSFTFLLLLFLSVPAFASAASLYVEKTDGVVSVGDTIVLKAYIDTDRAIANAIDGSVILSFSSSTAHIEDINVASSILTVWPHSPSLSSDGKNIVFTGGIPGGFTGSHQLLFNIILRATAPGNYTLTPNASNLYLNDGKGTAVPLKTQALRFDIRPAKVGATPRNEWLSSVSNDLTPPASFTISLAQDPSVHDGKKYLFFGTTDAESGIDRYEVTEGSSPAEISDGVYILSDQTGNTRVTVSAYDKAGNVRISMYTPKKSEINILFIVVIILIGVSGIYFGLKLAKRRTSI